MMIVYEISWLPGVRRIVFISHFEPRSIILMRFVDCDEARSAGKVVYNPLGYVSILHQILCPLNASAINLLTTKISTLLVLSHKEVVV